MTPNPKPLTPNPVIGFLQMASKGREASLHAELRRLRSGHSGLRHSGTQNDHSRVTSARQLTPDATRGNTRTTRVPYSEKDRQQHASKVTRVSTNAMSFVNPGMDRLDADGDDIAAELRALAEGLSDGTGGIFDGIGCGVDDDDVMEQRDDYEGDKLRRR